MDHVYGKKQTYCQPNSSSLRRNDPLKVKLLQSKRQTTARARQTSLVGKVNKTDHLGQSEQEKSMQQCRGNARDRARDLSDGEPVSPLTPEDAEGETDVIEGKMLEVEPSVGHQDDSVSLNKNSDKAKLMVS
ncbi:unnamed protein product [Protopolystoma xenopodis]|uniref:Uncharacterized protein n=1 Tax=Protopolystoma xenopodis TaxID=117903 RepID=A0A3S4ZXQ9_9PLAT|nr:unnamed protein product [Protopolystoma xenopodis]